MAVADRARDPRVLVRRESVRSYSTAQERTDSMRQTPPRLLVSAYVVYGDCRDAQEFEESLLPVVWALLHTRSHVTAGFVVRASTFDPAFLRHAVERCHGQGVTTVVEVVGTWGLSALEMLWSIRPRYLRVGPEWVRGSASLPEQHQSLVRLAQFAQSHGIPLMARGVETREERAALLAAGITLFQAPESGAPDGDPLADLGSLGSATAPTILRFPLRPTGR